jgi:hypothetical protein
VRLTKLDRILSAESDLQPLLAKARDLRALAGLIDAFLPPDLARQARVGNFREGDVLLVTGNGAAAAKLRLLAPSLSKFLSKQERWQVNSVSVRVQPNRSQAAAVAPKKSVYLSTPTLDSLRALHEAMRASPARAALGKLLQRHGAPRPRRETPPPQKTVIKSTRSGRAKS